MGLKDWFRRAPAAPPDELRELWTHVGRLEGTVERLKGLELTWADYHDKLNRLVQRLEKRQQRADARAEGGQLDAAAIDPATVRAEFEMRAAQLHRQRRGA